MFRGNSSESLFESLPGIMVFQFSGFRLFGSHPQKRRDGSLISRPFNMNRHLWNLAPAMLDCPHDFCRLSYLSKRMALTLPVHRRSGVNHSNKILRFGLALITTATFALLSACGTQSPTPPAIAVTFTPGFTPPTAMTVSEPCGVAATVTNDSRNQGVTWTASCSNAPCGTFTPTAASASMVPITYTSPAVAPTGGTVTLTATSVTDPAKNATSAAIPIGQNSAGCTAP
jgi:hypothetical protein